MIGVRTQAHWFGELGRPLVGWLSRPAEEVDPVAAPSVLIVPPIGYEYWTCHRALRTLAESLAVRGHVVMRLDLRGMGDSSGDLWDPGLVAEWRSDIGLALAALRGFAGGPCTVLGLRLGANLALSADPELGVDRFVAWMPIASTRRYLKELKLLSTTALDADGTDDGTAESGARRYFAGNVFTPTFLADLASCEIDPSVRRGEPTLVVDDTDHTTPDALLDQLRQHTSLEHRRADGIGQILSQPTEYAVPPSEHIDAIVDWIGVPEPTLAATPGSEPQPLKRVVIHAQGHAVVENVVRLGEHRLLAVETSSAASGIGSGTGTQIDATTVVFLNTGSEHHVGAGRVWVEFARQLAAEGHVAVRCDFEGWGESPDNGYPVGRPYDQQGVADVATIVHALRARGHRRIVLVGICAGAWVALRACPLLDAQAKAAVRGVLAFNAQLYWQPGDPVEATMTETRARRTPDRRREEWGRRWGVWTLLDMLGIQLAPGRWISKLAALPFPVWFCFAPGDDGEEYLVNRQARRMRVVTRRGNLQLRRLAHLDHPMHRHWHRQEGLDQIRALLATCDEERRS